MKKLNKLSTLLLTLALLSACGVATNNPDSDSSSSENSVSNNVPSGFSTVTKNIQTIGSNYISFEGLIHSSCTNELISPRCTQRSVQTACHPGVSQCAYNPGGTYTTYEEIRYINNCSWIEAGSPSLSACQYN